MARCLQDVMLAMHWYFFGLFARRAGGCSETARWAEKYPLRLFSLSVHLDRLDGWPAVLHGRSSSLSLDGRVRLGWWAGRSAGRESENPFG